MDGSMGRRLYGELQSAAESARATQNHSSMFITTHRITSHHTTPHVTHIISFDLWFVACGLGFGGGLGFQLIPVEKLTKGKAQDSLELLQWLYQLYFTTHSATTLLPLASTTATATATATSASASASSSAPVSAAASGADKENVKPNAPTKHTTSKLQPPSATSAASNEDKMAEKEPAASAAGEGEEDGGLSAAELRRVQHKERLSAEHNRLQTAVHAAAAQSERLSERLWRLQQWLHHQQTAAPSSPAHMQLVQRLSQVLTEEGAPLSPGLLQGSASLPRPKAFTDCTGLLAAAASSSSS
jgi:hypothetical protein